MSFVLLPLLAQLHSILGMATIILGVTDVVLYTVKSYLWPSTYDGWKAIRNPADRLWNARWFVNRATWTTWLCWVLTGPWSLRIAVAFGVYFAIAVYFALPKVEPLKETNENGEPLARFTWDVTDIAISGVLALIGILAMVYVYRR